MAEKEMEAAMGLMRRIPPKYSETALSALLSLLPQHSSDLLSQVDQPLQDLVLFINIDVQESILISRVFTSLKHHLAENARFYLQLLTKIVNALVANEVLVSNEVKATWTCARLFNAYPEKSSVLTVQVICDVDFGKEFILCEYNRDADSYRSPWSNKYHPPLEDGPFPSTELRNLEIEANDVFAIYRDQYYEGGISSVYMWEDDNEGFVACFLIKKDGSKSGHGRRGYLHEGAWDAIHVIEVGPEEEGTAQYCLTSTIMLSLTTDNESSGTFNLSGSLRRQMKMRLQVAEGHLCNMGKMIEEMEGKLRNSLDQVYFGKTKEMVCTLRPPAELLPMRLPDSRDV